MFIVVDELDTLDQEENYKEKSTSSFTNTELDIIDKELHEEISDENNVSSDKNESNPRKKIKLHLPITKKGKKN